MSNLLSIITINYNDAIGLKKTMDSVQSQTWQEFEHIIIDGNSADNSVEVIKSYDYSNLKWLSENDTGIYNAMNKGVDRASGRYLLFLNSGDFLEHNHVLHNIHHFFEKDCSVMSGNIIFDNDGHKRLREHPEEMTFSYLIGNAISHPSTFIKKDLFEKYGRYNEDLKIVSDWSFFIKVLGLNNESYCKIPETISVFDASGISSRKENFEQVYKEREEVLKKQFPRIYNNVNDTFIFNKFISMDKRFKHIRFLDNFPFFRKLATALLSFVVFFAKLFNPSK